jgi:hypothetical protein
LGLRGIEWVIFCTEGAKRAGIVRGFNISTDAIFGMNFGWHEHRDAAGGFGIPIRSQVFDLSGRFEEFSVIRKRA